MQSSLSLSKGTLHDAKGLRQAQPPDWHYTHNANGQIEKKNDIHYAYDASGQLICEGEQTYAYDAAGNCLNEKASYQSDNQLHENQHYAFRYDKRGNLIKKIHKQTKETTEYSWNLFDQLTQVLRRDKDNTLFEGYRFSYDGLNRRTQKTYRNTHSGTYHTHYYLYDRHNLVAILDKDKKLLASIVHGSGIDTPLAITTHNHQPLPLTELEKAYVADLSEIDQQTLQEAKTQRTYYYHTDHQGSITALTDQDGKIVESFTYDAYGTILEHKTTEGITTYNPFAYTGREYDAADLYFYRARYYDPQTRRFLSKDPIEFLSGDWNWYRYVGGDPVDFVDPMGLAANNGVGEVLKAVPEVTGAGLQKTTSDSDSEDISSEKVGTSAGNDTQIKGKKLPECGKIQGHKDSHKEYASQKGDVKFERDHMPSGGALIKNATDRAEEVGMEISQCIIDDILNDADTVMMPQDVHKGGDTFRGKNTQDKIVNDSQDLNKAKQKDIDKMKENIKKEKEKSDTSEEREECLENIEKGLDSKEFKKYDPEAHVDNVLYENIGEECNKKLRERWEKFLDKYKDL